ncbi:hypothetical protein K461DRAFT_81200 [Myriangium duriaei CBS 260.36]|uniref:Dynein light intermediate chain n=1 Tax=Myriangium duriaei CBS 260.36 TaxID=1168546 RepID=A0A9P4J9U5_9PEZI|nr:hypothetical protein K461DRAFT_81200 [Myriangium duriaei CBS 260.36]
MASVLPSHLDARHSNHNRIASTTSASSSSPQKKEIWSTLLSDVASSKKVPEKRLLVLGGTPDSQRDLIDSLAPEQPSAPQQQAQRRGNNDRAAKTRRIPLANRFALGYTYRDVQDVDGEDTLARISIYTLSEPAPEYAPLLDRLLTAAALPDTAVAILLDWAAPWSFVQDLRAWVRLLKDCLGRLPAAEQRVLEDNDARWRAWRDADGSAAGDGSGVVSVPLGPGEYDEPLGVPVVVVCQNTHEVERLEKEQAYKEVDFDFVLQFLRTVGLKHGAGLVYTMPNQPGQTRALMQWMMQIGEGLGMGKDEGLRHNVIDRDRVFVPPGWDSWGKIRVLREGFDIEGVSRAWSVDIQEALDSTQKGQADAQQFPPNDDESADTQTSTSTETLYATRVSNPKTTSSAPPTIEVQHVPDQTFLAAQLERLESFLAEDATAKKQRSTATPSSTSRRTPAPSDEAASRPSINDQIGPVQFNMGGIQYDADEALRRIKVHPFPVLPVLDSFPPSQC